MAFRDGIAHCVRIPAPRADGARLGDRGEQRLLGRIEAVAAAAPYQIAEVYALRRDPDAMFKWLDRAWAARDPGVSYRLYDP